MPRWSRIAVVWATVVLSTVFSSALFAGCADDAEPVAAAADAAASDGAVLFGDGWGEPKDAAAGPDSQSTADGQLLDAAAGLDGALQDTAAADVVAQDTLEQDAAAQDVAGQIDSQSTPQLSATHCFPCMKDADCQPAGQALCIQFADGARYCAQPCGPGGACPAGNACIQASSATGGGSAQQCLPTSGACSCTPAAIAAGAATSCTKGNINGQCKGKRVCTQAGLGPCDAPTPAAETCNTLDDDCDGEVDEGLQCSCPQSACLIDGKCLAAGSKNPLDACQVCNPLQNPSGWSTQNNLPCDDGNACTTGDKCQSGKCVAGPAVDCSAWDGVCTVGVCGAGGCAAKPKSSGASCDDGDPCTTSDLCVQGQCKGATKDCSAFDNGCGGKGICVAGQCQTSGGGTPVCSAGSEETESQPCGNCGTQTRKRVCSSSCAWGTWSAWSGCSGEGICAPGATESCSTEGCEVKTCTNSCQWGPCGLKSGAVCAWDAGTNYQCCGSGQWQFCSKTCNWFPCAAVPAGSSTCK